MPPDVLRMLKASEPSTPETDDGFGLYHPFHYAWESWRRYREHGLFPRSGGYDNQLVSWHLDCNALDSRYHKHWLEAKKEFDAAHKPRG